MSYKLMTWHSVWLLNEQSHVTLLLNFALLLSEPVTLAQFPDPLHGSTLKSQSALLSLRAIPLSASTAKAKTFQVSAKCRSYKLVCTKSKLVNISISFCFPFPGKQKKIDTNGARVNMKHPHVNNIAEQSQHLNLMPEMKSVVQHFGVAEL